MTGSSAAGQLTGDSEEDKTFKLGDVATVTETVSMNTISRDQQRRCVTVTAAIADGYNVTHVTSAAQQAVSGLTLPEGVTAEFNGENEQIMEAMSQLLLMLLLGVVLVYFIMVAQFQSLKSPFIVMFTIPLAFTGGFLALLIAGIEVSVISLIGFVMLVGIIVNNGIVLVDYDHRRGRDPPAADPDDQSDHDFGPDRHRHGEKRRHGADAAHRRGVVGAEHRQESGRALA